MAGEVVHYEIAATDVERAKRFWEGVFGWEFGPSMSDEFDYRMARVSEGSGAALQPGDDDMPDGLQHDRRRGTGTGRKVGQALVSSALQCKRGYRSGSLG